MSPEPLLEIKDMLLQCESIFSECALECAGSLMMSPFVQKDSWTIVERMPGNFDHNISLGNGNDQFQGIFTVGISTDDAQKLIDTKDEMEVLDVFGEFLNAFCGALMDKSEITELFGVLIQSLPQYSAQQVYFPKAWACMGSIQNEQLGSMTIGVILRRNRIL